VAQPWGPLTRVVAVQTRVDGAAVYRARSSTGMTQSQVARTLDLSGGERVSEWERGVRTPAVRLIPQLAAVLGVTPLEFLALPNGVDLKALRLAVGRTSAEVAAEVHVSQTYLRWESGRVPVGEGPGLRSRLARALHVSRAGLEAAVGTTRRSPGD
jgi:transcriptional regulator with XRE-family HTH domain